MPQDFFLRHCVNYRGNIAIYAQKLVNFLNIYAKPLENKAEI